jgi:hypothetical protein
VSDLITRMARREAAALTLIPALRLFLGEPEPIAHLHIVECPGCPADLPVTRPIREVTYVDDPDLPSLALLRCEDVIARSLLPLSLIRVGAVPAHLTSRAAYWSRLALDTRADLWRGLELLDAAESWFDDALPALRDGGLEWSGGQDAVLPMSSRQTRPARSPEELASLRRGLHCLGPHAGELDSDLNAAYLSAREAAVRDAFDATARRHAG